MYIGRGLPQRPHAHIREALAKTVGEKNRKINAICDQGGGIIVFVMKSDISFFEAAIVESGLISTIGLSNLLNRNSGVFTNTYHFTEKSSIRLGMNMLFEAFEKYKVSDVEVSYNN